MGRYRIDACNRVLKSEQDYQNAADRLADVKWHQTCCLLEKAKVQYICSTNNNMNSISAFCFFLYFPSLSHHLTATPYYTPVLSSVTFCSYLAKSAHFLTCFQSPLSALQWLSSSFLLVLFQFILVTLLVFVFKFVTWTCLHARRMHAVGCSFKFMVQTWMWKAISPLIQLSPWKQRIFPKMSEYSFNEGLIVEFKGIVHVK